MTAQAIERAGKRDKAIKNFKVTPYEDVSKRLDEATKKTILKLDKNNKRVVTP